MKTCENCGQEKILILRASGLCHSCVATKEKAKEQFKRVLNIVEPLNLPDDTPLARCLPGIWPTLGELKEPMSGK